MAEEMTIGEAYRLAALVPVLQQELEAYRGILTIPMDAAFKQAIDIATINKREAEKQYARAVHAETKLAAADLALQRISLTLGGTDEWTEQENMIADVQRQVEEVKARADHEPPPQA